jgi:hypothetical protein
MNISIKRGLLIFIAFLSLGAGIYFYFKSKMVQNTEGIVFLDKTELAALLTEDADHYYDTFNKTDLKMRKSKTIDEYKKTIVNSCCEGEEENKEKVINCIEKVETRLESKRSEKVDGIDMGKWLDIPWRIGFVCDKKYENGLPHTRGNVIVLNNKEVLRRNIPELCKLLIHEKTHVYQKMYKSEFTQSLEKEYEIVERKEGDEKIPANPDVDEYIYRKKSDGFTLKTEYKKDPKTFRDVLYPNNDSTLEHPNEIVAYSVENLYG